MIKGLIADIQRASMHDGPGFRTTVFLKGCPLCCAWCHNPECISFEKQILCYPEKCIGCGKCDEGCFAGAKVVCGKEYSPRELLEEILLDKEYYGKDGGVTFSGGEPLAQPEFLKEMITLCKEHGIHCAIETSLIYDNEAILQSLDLVMADFKIWDSTIHQQYTGVSNEKIKENFMRLNQLHIPVIARTPVIPEVEQGIDKISAFLKELPNVIQYELLPYHPLGVSKQLAMGKIAREFSIPSAEYMKGLEQYAYIQR